LLTVNHVSAKPSTLRRERTAKENRVAYT